MDEQTEQHIQQADQQADQADQPEQTGQTTDRDAGERLGRDALRAAAGLHGGVTTAYVDVSRTEPQAAREVEVRWRGLREGLRAEGAPDTGLDEVEERVLTPTGLGGRVTRVVVTDGTSVAVDTTVRDTLGTRVHHGRIAHLAALAGARGRQVRQMVVLADSTGAEVTVTDTLGPGGTEAEVEGDHDVLHKVRGGGLAHRRLQQRVEDSVERNAQHVARELDRMVASERPDLVLLGGDDQAVTQVVEHVGGAVTERLRRLRHGSRAPGASEEQLDLEVAAAGRSWLRDRRTQVLDRLFAAGGGVTGVGATVEALRQGAVETLVLVDGALADRTAAAGPDPLHLGLVADEVTAFGVDDPVVDAADEVLVRAALGQGADVELLAGPADGLTEGVGAVLRFDSRPTPPDGVRT